MTDTQVAGLEKFSMRGVQLLEHGRTMNLLSSAGQLNLHVKVYAEGGENSLHAHKHEDHAFFVLAGRATFTAEDGSKTEVLPYEGMMVPRHAYYSFMSSGEENLVILRISSADQVPEGRPETRHSIDGGPIKNAGTPVPATGKLFGV